MSTGSDLSREEARERGRRLGVQTLWVDTVPPDDPERVALEVRGLKLGPKDELQRLEVLHSTAPGPLPPPVLFVMAWDDEYETHVTISLDDALRRSKRMPQ
jgi:hypothetical protein